MRFKVIIMFAVACGFSFSESKGQQTTKITPSGIGYLEYLPQDYNKNSNDYPIVVFLHGVGEKGTTSTDPTTLKNSVQKVANQGLPKYIKNGQQYPFIVIAPQLKSSYGAWPASYVMDVLNEAKKHLRINEKRIYITGLSMGGYGTWTTLGVYPDVFAAAVPICSGGNVLNKACAIAAENIPLWAFHGTGDNTVHYSYTTNMVDAVNKCTPKPSPLAKVTLYSGAGHGIWDQVYKETNAIDWMLSFTRGDSDGGSANNIAPVSNAGSDKTTSSSSISITGSGTDKDGTIISYKWTQYLGPTAKLTNADTRTVTLSGLKPGKYYMGLTVEDNNGATGYDKMVVTVTGTSTGGTTANVAPVANAGADIRTTASSITINGSGTDKDGKIVSYKWTQYLGPTATISNTNTPKLSVSGLRPGKFYFRLTVTDDDGATHFDNVLVVVTSNSTANISPVSNAGPDQRLRGIVSSLLLRGSGSDKDGRIVSYQWSQYGGAPLTLKNADSPTVTVTNISSGKYYLKLTVEDDDGAIDHDNMLIVVNES